MNNNIDRLPTVTRPGSVIAQYRNGVEHFGIYAGRGRVVEYRKLGEEFEVVVASGCDWEAIGNPIRVVRAPASSEEAQVVIRRAASRVGERAYGVLTNNCEHFAMWCFDGVSRSGQVRGGLFFAGLIVVGALVSAA